MATWEDVRQLALALPESAEEPARDGRLAWGVRVPDLGAKEALLADDGDLYLTTPHFDGFPAILVRLDRMPVPSSRSCWSKHGWLGRRSAWRPSTCGRVLDGRNGSPAAETISEVRSPDRGARWWEAAEPGFTYAFGAAALS